MNDLLVQLLSIREDINHDGWLVIPPSSDEELYEQHKTKCIKGEL